MSFGLVWLGVVCLGVCRFGFVGGAVLLLFCCYLWLCVYVGVWCCGCGVVCFGFVLFCGCYVHVYGLLVCMWWLRVCCFGALLLFCVFVVR